MGDDEFVEVWDLQDYEIESEKADDPMDKGSLLDGDVSEGAKEVMVKRHRPTPVAWIPLATGNTFVSISWDGSLVVVMDRKKPECPENSEDDTSKVYQSLFAVYQCTRDDKGTSEKPSSRMSLVRYDVERTCPGLGNYVGDGVFHMVDKSNPDPKDELFVACNGITIDIYSTFEQWTPLRSIVMESALANQNQPFDMGSAIFHQLQGRYLITTNETVGFTFDIVQGTLMSFSTTVPMAYIYMMNYLSTVSPDGLLIAISGFRHVSVYRTQTWTLQGTYVFDEIASDERVEQPTFMDDGNLLHVMVGQSDNVRWQRRPGYTLDVATMQIVGRVAADGMDIVRLSPLHLDGSVQGVVCSGYTKLWHMRLEDRRTLRSPTGDIDRCTDCCDHQDSLYSGVEEGTSPSGLHLKVQRVDASFGPHSKRKKRSALTVSMTDPTNSQVKKMVFPLPRGYQIDNVAFFADFRYLLIVSEGTFLAWSVPTTFEGDFRLQMLFYEKDSKEWTICSHGIVRCRSEDKEKLTVIGYVKQPFTKSTAAVFLTGLAPMLQFYELADVGLKQEFVRYFGRYINSYPDKDDDSLNVMTLVSMLWTQELHQTTYEFIKGLLSLPGTRWVPNHNVATELRPLTVFLELAKTNSLANTGVQIIVDYCLRQAKASQDPYFLVPILQCLPSLVDSNQLYSELASTIYREVAFFPAQGRDFIVANHMLINPSTFRWRFWKTYPWGLHQYRDQVLQFSTDNIPNPPKGNFTRDIFQAPFDLLWHRSQEAGSQEATDELKEVTTARTLFSWPHAIWTMISRKCRLKYNATVECYPFELETLDNPALMALVEYKWYFHSIYFSAVHVYSTFFFHYNYLHTCCCSLKLGTRSGFITGWFGSSVKLATTSWS